MKRRPCRDSVLIIAKPDDKQIQQLALSLPPSFCHMTIEPDLAKAINYAQYERINVIIMDASIRGIKPEQAVRIFLNMYPGVKIIIKTKSNSKKLESRIHIG